MAPQQQALPPGLENVLQQAYVSDLLSYPLDRLHKEPELLRVDAERISRQMQEVAVGHYRAFITAAESLQFITQEVANIDQHLESLIAEIPELTSGCTEFMDSAQQILEKRKLNKTLLANHTTLLDLLEIPQLMDTCVRNGNYDEALDLEAFVAKLATMHMRLPIIQSLVADVRQNTQSLLAQLLQRLRSNVQVPECLRIIGYLRRLAVFNDHELRLQFLKCREAWLAGLLEDLDQGNPYMYLKSTADCHRVNLFDVVAQYRAIFSDDTSEASDGGLLYSWAMHRITCHLDLLRDLLPKITDGDLLSNILDSSMYCGMSLARAGLDFRGLLPPIFESCVQDLFARNMSIALQHFQYTLDNHRWVDLLSVRLSTRDAEDRNAPPQSLIEHPPLAVFVNGILAALNQLRLCALLSLQSRLATEFQKTLQCVSDSLLHYHATRILKDNESKLFLSCCRAYLEVASPYSIACFTRCYPGVTVNTKGITDGIRKLLSSTAFPVVENGTARLRSVPAVVEDIITNLNDPSNGHEAQTDTKQTEETEQD